MEQPPADGTQLPMPHVLLCSPWAPLSVAAPQPHPGAPCAVPMGPKQAPEGRIPFCAPPLHSLGSRMFLDPQGIPGAQGSVGKTPTRGQEGLEPG